METRLLGKNEKSARSIALATMKDTKMGLLVPCFGLCNLFTDNPDFKLDVRVTFNLLYELTHLFTKLVFTLKFAIRAAFYCCVLSTYVSHGKV